MVMTVKRALASVSVVSVTALSTLASRAEPTNPTPTSTTPIPAPTGTTAPPYLSTRIRGTITVPATFSGSHANGEVELGDAGFDCEHIVIRANSRELGPYPFPQPVWTRSVHATGDYDSGHCSYSLSVPGNSEFKLVGEAPDDDNEFDCDVVQVTVGSTPAWQSVAIFTTKTDNLSVSAITCVVIW
jgi:hypothetical protein